MSFRQVKQNTLSDEAANQIRDAILSGALPAGYKLVERDLAEQMGMSRIPIREAIQKLADEGLVRKIPHKGTVIYVPTPLEIEEISSLRVLLEQFVVERCMERWQPQYAAFFEDIIEEMRSAEDQQMVTRLHELDMDFHHRLWEISDHSLLLEVAAGLRARINRFLYEAAMAQTAGPQHYITSHVRLLNAIKEGDIEQGRMEMARHINSSKTRILQYFKEKYEIDVEPEDVENH